MSLRRVSGGGVNGQADAVKLGIARALMIFNIELRKKLRKPKGWLAEIRVAKNARSTDKRAHRKRFQYSKR